MNLYWLEQTAADIPADNHWLSQAELFCLNGHKFLKRRSEWRLGRWTAKRAVSSYLDLPHQPSMLAKIEIRSAPSGAPEVLLDEKPAGLAISLSHRAGHALCALMHSSLKLGCDLELIEPHSAAFLADFFTEEEQQLVARAPAADVSPLLSLLWSGKESALKALHAGLRLSTNDVIVSLGNVAIGPDHWGHMQVRHVSGQMFHGWWREDETFVRTLVAESATECPIHLDAISYKSMMVNACA